ncbi:unnamed protein product [Bursaphelenchus okinawaensis]|uniref:Receptor protein-tyrosine kinase n=1 Tax=Bursaphelenchus okinawaensis TaxID=465554 RepID=A0A811JUK8_9BILA|nr:unnamed protein product [Bursaphelenchus okinawaensis]CAG9083797.1 unnamed protein product [Bursaphelenchus okinawaensis]
MRQILFIAIVSCVGWGTPEPIVEFKFEEQPLGQVINSNQSLSLKCTYTVNSPVKAVVEWYKDGVLLSSDFKDNKILFIERPSPSDEGFYQCQVKLYDKDKVKWVYLSRKAKIQLSRIRHFVHQPKSQKVFLNQSVTFRCVVDATGTEDLSVEWLHNNHRVISGHSGVVILPSTNTLELSNVKKNSSGTYKCIARLYEHSLTSQTAILDVIEGIVPQQPTFSLKPSDKDVYVGQEFLLECMANGSPQPKITWYRGSEELKVDNNRLRFVGADRSNVLVTNVKHTDAGNYLCVVENGNGKIENAATIQVIAAPKIVKRPKSGTKTETEDIDFECTATGVPPPRITWFKGGEIIVPSEYFIIEPGRLRISGLIRADESVYQCFAENEYGSDQSAAKLVVTKAEFLSQLIDQRVNYTEKENSLTQALISGEDARPLSPTNIQVQGVGGRSVRLRWSSPIGISLPDEVEYVVYYRKDTDVNDQTYNTTTSSATLLSLEPDTEYKIAVSAVENHVLGKKSEEVTVRTKKEQIVVGSARNLKAKVLSSDSAQITWDSPTDAPLNIKYKLFYKRADSNGELETQTVVVKPTYTLHGLDKNSEYVVRVASVGPDDQGKTSDSLKFKTYSDIPDAPPLNVKAEAYSPNAIILRWSPPVENKRNGDITGYKIRYKMKGSKAVNVNVNGNINEFKIEGLEPGNSYQIRVAAQTLNGTGVYSDWVSAVTLEDDEIETIPGGPAELMCYATSNSIHLTWSPPQGSGVVVKGYVIGWGLYIPDVEKITVDGSVHQYTINNLTAGRDYVISVRATNNAGTGFPIYETASTLERSASPPRDPGERQKSAIELATPVGVQAEAVSDGTIRVSWTDTTNAFNQVYVVRYSSNEDPTQFYYKNSSDTETLVDNLQPNTQYEFAVSRKGASQWSMSTLCKTGSSAPSSAPRDLTVVPNSPTARHDPNTVTLNWQPPKYANGEIEEYIVLYSDRLDVPDREWIVDTVKGERLSMKVVGLTPNSVYYFKIQARNVKGYGPLSPVVTYTPGRVGYNTPLGNNNVVRGGSGLGSVFGDFEKYMPYIILASVCVLFTIMLILCIFFCASKCKGEKKDEGRVGYVMNSKTPTHRKSSRGTPQKDCWITHPSNRVELFEVPNASVNELKRLTNHSESPIPHYQHLQARSREGSNCSFVPRPTDRVPTVSFALDSRQNYRKSLPPTLNVNSRASAQSQRGILRNTTITPENIRSKSSLSNDSAIMTQSSHEASSACSWDINTCNYVKDAAYVKDARRVSAQYAVLKNTDRIISTRNTPTESQGDGDSNGTVPRNYHQSSVSLESRQRTPQILYTGSNRQQITRIELGSDKGSSFGGSNTGLQGGETPPTASDGMYQTVRSNPLRSFVNSANPPPPALNLYSSTPPEPRMASVRPVVVASSTSINRPMSKFSNSVLPVGRAQAQPRVNLSNYSPNYSLHGSREDCTSAQDEDLVQVKARSNQVSPPQSVIHEDVNASQIENIITQLQTPTSTVTIPSEDSSEGSITQLLLALLVTVVESVPRSRSPQVNLDKNAEPPWDPDPKVVMPVVRNAKTFGQTSVELAQEVAQLKNTQGSTDAFFVADVALVDELMNRWMEVLPRVRPFYSVQCNADQVMLAALARYPTIGFHCTTRENTTEVMAVTENRDRIFYSNPCWTRGSLRHAADSELNFLGFDSARDLRRIYEQAPQANLLLNICVAPNEEDLSSTFGCCLEESPELLQTAFDLGLNVIGIGFTIGNGKTSPRMFDSSIEIASQLFDIGEKIGHDMRILNVGGGFESASCHFEAVANYINNALVEHFSHRLNLEVMATPGRFFAASVFSLVTNITERDEVDASDITNDDFDAGNKAFVYRTNEGYYGPFGCINRNSTPECHPLFETLDKDMYCTSVMGPTTDEFDRIMPTCQLRQLAIGDWLLWSNMGAYSLGNNASLDSELCEQLPIYYVKDKTYWYDNDSGIDNSAGNSAGNSDNESVISDDDGEDLSERVWSSWMADFVAGRERASNSF